jgi:starch synthase
MPVTNLSAPGPNHQVAHRILMASSEVVGFSKTGGLGDVAGSLPVALARRGHHCAIITPLYRCARSARVPPEPTPHTFEVTLAGRTVRGRFWRSSLGPVPVYLVEQPDYYERDDPKLGRGIYQLTTPDGQRRDYPDNCERFVFFNQAIVEALHLLDEQFDILHVNDWQTALAPVYLRCDQSSVGRRPRTLLTIHNIAFQGVFPHPDMHLTGLDWKLFNPQQLEYYGQLSFLKGGLVFSDLINTVSPTYAKEIQTPYYGCGLQGVLTEVRDRLSGIVNGVDYSVWNPAADPRLPARYTPDALEPGKPLCKAALQTRLNLAVEPATPLLGVVARLTEQKGVDLIGEAAPDLLAAGHQLVLLGEGDPAFHRLFSDLHSRFPGRMGLHLGFNEDLAHLIEAGSDLFLMPSLYEPSGLNQLYSLKYGTPPVVRSTGGLADTVVDTNPATLAAGTATGFRFAAHSRSALHDAIARALDLYRNRPDTWRKVMRTGMSRDWSWDRSAAEYEQLYHKLSVIA